MTVCLYVCIGRTRVCRGMSTLARGRGRYPGPVELVAAVVVGGRDEAHALTNKKMRNIASAVRGAGAPLRRDALGEWPTRWPLGECPWNWNCALGACWLTGGDGCLWCDAVPLAS